MSFLIAILILGLIIFVHELGHFISAKVFRIPVSEFSVGMGPQIISAETAKTNYSLRVIPIGGYVNIEGMEIGSEKENGFNSKPAYQRLIVLFAGVFMNFITAIILLFFIAKLNGRIEYEKQAYIGTISKQSLNYGLLLEKDKILEIEGNKINVWEEIPVVIASLGEKNDVNIKVERNGEEKSLNLKLMTD
ncbi:MAG: site-2 protease family protein, partial [Fusobacterium sp.]|nr:site-2 protease family protein [Fusobacterium sp.]